MSDTNSKTILTVESLRRCQANTLVSFLNLKKYHWFTFGPQFRDLHLLFEEQANEVLATLDELAERTLMIDGIPIGDPGDHLKSASVRASSGELSVRAMIEEALKTAEKFIGDLHADTEVAAASGDIGTADLFTRIVQIHQKHRWFLKSLLKT
jgi:starvation-inducible DNA-binding protein